MPALLHLTKGEHAMNVYQIFSKRPSGEERLVSVAESTSKEAALTSYKEVNGTMVGNTYRAVKVG